MSIVAQACNASGWCPGTAAAGTADPGSTPDPSSVIESVVPALKAVLLSSAGAMLLLMLGVYALIWGWKWYVRMFRRPRQMTLF